MYRLKYINNSFVVFYVLLTFIGTLCLKIMEETHDRYIFVNFFNFSVALGSKRNSLTENNLKMKRSSWIQVKI